MKNSHFITAVCMTGPREQLIELSHEFIPLGYRIGENFDDSAYPLLVNNFQDEAVLSIMQDNSINKSIIDRYYIDHFNPELFKALAMMTDIPEGIAGEYWVYIGDADEDYKNLKTDIRKFQNNSLYKQVKSTITDYCPLGIVAEYPWPKTSNTKRFRKATREEIIAHFTRNEQAEPSTTAIPATTNACAEVPIREEFTLPERWCIKAANDAEAEVVLDYVRSLGISHWHSNQPKYYYLHIHNDEYGGGFSNKLESHTTITFDQFVRYVINPNTTRPATERVEQAQPAFTLPEKWCVKRTNENKDVLNKWANEKDTNDSWYQASEGYIFSEKASWDRHSAPSIIKGFTEITFEQFMEHVIGESQTQPATQAHIAETPAFVLPEKWAVERTAENYQVINKWANDNKLPTDYKAQNAYMEHSSWIHSEKASPLRNPDAGRVNRTCVEGFTPITFEQFQEYVLNTPSVATTAAPAQAQAEPAFVLPRSWYIKRNSTNCRAINNWINNSTDRPRSYFDNKGYMNVTLLDSNEYIVQSTSLSPVKGHTEITFEQFQEHVLNVNAQPAAVAATRQEEFVLPARWAVLRTPNNAKVLNNWAQNNRLPQEDRLHSGYYQKDKYLHSEYVSSASKTYSGRLSSKIEDGFTEITFGQFQQYVMNEPQAATAAAPRNGARVIIGYKCPVAMFTHIDSQKLKEGDILVRKGNGVYYGHPDRNEGQYFLPKELVETWEPVYEEDTVRLKIGSDEGTEFRIKDGIITDHNGNEWTKQAINDALDYFIEDDHVGLPYKCSAVSFIKIGGCNYSKNELNSLLETAKKQKSA